MTRVGEVNEKNSPTPATDFFGLIFFTWCIMSYALTNELNGAESLLIS